MKILHVSLYFKPIWEAGGPSRGAYEMCRGLVARGHDVTVYTTNYMNSPTDLPINQPVDVDGMTVYYFDNLRRFMPRPGTMPPLPYALRGVAKRQMGCFDIVHLHEHRTIPSVLVSYQAKRQGIPYVVQPHGSVLPFFQKQTMKRLFDQAVGTRTLLNASTLLALTSVEREQIRAMGVNDKRIVDLPNGINPADYGDIPTRGSFRQSLGLKDEPMVLYLARFHKIKGPDILVRAFKLVLKDIPNAKLVMVGPDDGFLDEVKATIKEEGLSDSILLPGPIYETEQKRAAYADADVYVLPSRYETFPVSVLESWSSGTPVIITDQCGLYKDIDGGGTVVPVEAKAMANALDIYLRDPAKGREHGANGRKMTIEHYTWPKVVEELEHIYLDALVDHKM